MVHRVRKFCEHDNEHCDSTKGVKFLHYMKEEQFLNVELIVLACTFFTVFRIHCFDAKLYFDKLNFFIIMLTWMKLSYT
jgi:hypothetical protein